MTPGPRLGKDRIRTGSNPTSEKNKSLAIVDQKNMVSQLASIAILPENDGCFPPPSVF